MVFLVIIGESFGGVALIAGLLTRFTAASFIVIMIGAIATIHWPQGFFMNRFGHQQGEGFEYHLLVIAMMSAALVLIGGRKWALDAVIGISGTTPFQTSIIFERQEGKSGQAIGYAIWPNLTYALP